MKSIDKDAVDLAEKSFTQSMAVSVIGIIICAACLCATTWAWFSVGVSSPSNNIKSAICVVTPSLETEGNSVSPLPDGSYRLLAGTEYTVTITAAGTAKSAYCKLLVDGEEYYTQQIHTEEPDNKIVFTLTFTSDTILDFDARWGESSREEREIIDGKNYIDLIEQ